MLRDVTTAPYCMFQCRAIRLKGCKCPSDIPKHVTYGDQSQVTTDGPYRQAWPSLPTPVRLQARTAPQSRWQIQPIDAPRVVSHGQRASPGTAVLASCMQRYDGYVEQVADLNLGSWARSLKESRVHITACRLEDFPRRHICER